MAGAASDRTQSFFCTVAGALLAGASLGMAVNNVIAMTPLIEASAGFQSANQAFFAGGVVFELLGSCLVIPLAEELLYRGVVERRLSLLCGSAPAIVLGGYFRRDALERGTVFCMRAF